MYHFARFILSTMVSGFDQDKSEKDLLVLLAVTMLERYD